MADNNLPVAEARSHMVVVVWGIRPGSGEERYLYKDATGWYVLGVGCNINERHYLTETDGELIGVTLP